MIELLIAGVSLFGEGHWRCVHKYDYPQRNVRETFVSKIHYRDDLYYTSSSKIIYSHLDKKDRFAQFSYKEKGKAHISGNSFYLEGHAFNIRKDFDFTHHFHHGYLKELYQYLNTNVTPEDKTLTVIRRTDKTMDVEHKKSGTVTRCRALIQNYDKKSKTMEKNTT